MIPTSASRISARIQPAWQRTLCVLSMTTLFGLAACGGGSDDPAGTGTGISGGTSTTGGASSEAGLVFTGTNNSARTGFAPPADATTCLAVKTSFIQVNCLKAGASAGTSEDLMITFAAPLAVGSVANLASAGSSTVEFLTTELAGTAVVTKFWGAEPMGTVTLTAIDAKSVTFKLAGVSLKADPLGGSSVSAGTILVDGSITVTLK